MSADIVIGIVRPDRTDGHFTHQEPAATAKSVDLWADQQQGEDSQASFAEMAQQ